MIHVPAYRHPLLLPQQAMDNIMPGFDKEIARLAQRLLIQGRPIDYHTGVIATKVTPGVPGGVKDVTGGWRDREGGNASGGEGSRRGGGRGAPGAVRSTLGRRKRERGVGDVQGSWKGVGSGRGAGEAGWGGVSSME